MSSWITGLFTSRQKEKAQSLPQQAKAEKISASEVCKRKGDAFLSAGNYDKAIACYGEATELNPNYAKAFGLLGYVLMETGQMDVAKVQLDRALALDGSNADVCYMLGSIAHQSSNTRAAIAHYVMALERDPGLLAACQRLSDISYDLFSEGRVNDAKDVLLKGLSLNASYSNFHYFLGNIFRHEGNFPAALAAYVSAINLNPGNIEANYSAGVIYASQQKWEQAIQHYRAALANGELIDVRWNLSHLLLMQGQYVEGFRHFECRLASGNNSQFAFVEEALKKIPRIPRWLGKSLDGANLLVWVEQGLGDTLMMLRYLPLLKKKFYAGRVYLLCPADLNGVVNHLGCVDAIYSDFAAANASGADFHCSLMSMPSFFATTLDSIPTQSPYLRLDSTLVGKWRERFAGDVRCKVGLVWAGGPLTSTDSVRSISLAEFRPLLELHDVTFVSLQKGSAKGQTATLGLELVDWMDECNSVMDTAALIQNLDLVITVDTSMVHLAGALGKKTWLLNRHGSEWRWGLDSQDSAWYPSVRIFRQTTLGDWATPLRTVMKELELFSRAFSAAH